jgi:hypothetical protein
MYTFTTITPTPMEEDPNTECATVALDVDYIHLRESEVEEVLRTPPRYAPSSLVSPPKLVRHMPGSNIWFQREDGIIVNHAGCIFPVPIRLFPDIDEDDVSEEKNIDDTYAENLRHLEEGIERGYVNVRRENINIMALEEGIARGHVNITRGSR